MIAVKVRHQRGAVVRPPNNGSPCPGAMTRWERIGPDFVNAGTPGFGARITGSILSTEQTSTTGSCLFRLIRNMVLGEPA
jgi:hypothetical protein